VTSVKGPGNSADKRGGVYFAQGREVAGDEKAAARKKQKVGGESVQEKKKKGAKRAWELIGQRLSRSWECRRTTNTGLKTGEQSAGNCRQSSALKKKKEKARKRGRRQGEKHPPSRPGQPKVDQRSDRKRELDWFAGKSPRRDSARHNPSARAKLHGAGKNRRHEQGRSCPGATD